MRESKAAALAAESEGRAGWRIAPWCRAVGISRPHFYNLDIRPRCVKLGAATVILESPPEYLQRVATEQAREAATA